MYNDIMTGVGITGVTLLGYIAYRLQRMTNEYRSRWLSERARRQALQRKLSTLV